MSPRTNGTNYAKSRPRHQDSLLPRPLLALLSLIINIVASMRVTGTHTKTLLLSLILSFRNTMESSLEPSTHQIWIPLRSRATLMREFLFTLAEFVLAVPLMDLGCHLESLNNNVLVWKTSWRKLLPIWLAILLVTIILWLECRRMFANSLLMIISSLCLAIVISLWLAWNVTGQRAEVSSTMLPKPSLSGSMKRISFASSPCRWVVMSRVSLKGSAEESRESRTQSRKSLERTSALMKNMATSTPAQPTLVLAWGPLSMLTCLDGPSTLLTNWRLAVRSFICNLVALVESLVVRLDTLMTSPTSTDWDTLRFNLSRRWLMVSMFYGRKMLNFKRSTLETSPSFDPSILW